MKGRSPQTQKAQLDKEEREHLEDVVTEMRDRVEANVRYQLEVKHDLNEKPDDDASLSGEKRDLVEAIELEAPDNHNWDSAYEHYITGVGYTIVNRLAALRCMEVREFIDNEVTRFREDGLTPAADRLVTEEYMLEEEAVLKAYRNACDDLAEEIEILFDRSTVYSVIDPDDDTFEDLCRMLDKVSDEVWRADDVLGWIYEYYNRPVVEALDAKNTLEPEDVGPANQFYTPHWVVRMLTDNSLGKLYLEATGQESAVPEPNALSPEERKERLVTPEDCPSIPEICTYLIPDEKSGDAPEFDHPSELRVIDPACGSGHFLLYAFDILERIWWAETDLDRAEIPVKVLEHNLYGVDIDLRSCQLSAFNLYLKARTRAEEEDGHFEMPNVDIVCADARVAEVEEGAEVLDEITGEGTDLRAALGEVIDTFQHTDALGSLIDVSGTLEEVFDSNKTQSELTDYNEAAHQSLNSFLKALRRAVEERTSDSFGEQNLKSFLNLLVVLTQEYDVALMNPPYGASGRMPPDVRDYVRDHYKYAAEYYINFFEACNRVTKQKGRVSMIVPRTFMFKSTFQEFREDFIGAQGSFDFLAEYGNDVLDNATVRTAGTVVRVGNYPGQESTGTFFRLHDVDSHRKEGTFLNTAFGERDDDIERLFSRPLSEFDKIPGSPISYWAPPQIRSLYDSDIVLDADNGRLENRRSLGDAKQGLITGDNDRFVRKYWEVNGYTYWKPFAKGGEDAWILPQVNLTVAWGDNGEEIRRYEGSRPQNTQYFFTEALTYTYMKESGRRFGYLHPESIFGRAGCAYIPSQNPWNVLSYTNSNLVTYLMICQTPDRQWEVGYVSKLPWRDELGDNTKLERLSREIVGHLISKRRYDFESPYYECPVLLGVLGVESPPKEFDHPHKGLREELELDKPDFSAKKDSSLSKLGTIAAKHLAQVEDNLQSCAGAIDEAVFDQFDISDQNRETVLQEISLRTNEDPRERKDHDPESIREPSDNFSEQVKDLLLHFTLRAIHGADDGIVPLSEIDGKDHLLTHIEAEFERVWGDYATDRLAEADEVLGNRSASDEAYPNLRAWLEDDLFEYHISKFDLTPILWRFSTERLISDPEGEGFGCLVDYHQLDASIFDRLQNQYLEPRRTYLRERQAAANSRRNDESLSTSERTDATEEYERCESGLEQLSVFEKQLGELAESNPREWPEENQERAAEAAERVAEFRERTASRLDTLEMLADLEDVDMEDLFSPSFYETVQENKDKWIDALNDLQTAFEAYAEDSSDPVEAHLYDLFEYYDELTGSSHYASNGILFMTYYFDQFEDAGQAQIGDAGVSERQRLLSELAANVDEYKELAEEISEDCDEVAAHISADWEERALSEVTTAGYQPNHKHGVAINITPLAEKNIVPEIVEDNVL